MSNVNISLQKRFGDKTSSNRFILALCLRNGKEIARHNYDGATKVLYVKREHMPPNHIMMLRTKEDLLNYQLHNAF